MPECKLGLNDKVLLEAQGRATKGKSIDLDDIKFHQYVFYFSLLLICFHFFDLFFMFLRIWEQWVLSLEMSLYFYLALLFSLLGVYAWLVLKMTGRYRLYLQMVLLI